MSLLNLGCGNRHLPGWINIDFVSGHPDVRAHDLSKGIPVPDESCDVVYHSHVLEHFSRADAKHFIAECFRVLKKGGMLRVAVPDLEGLARQYIVMLEKLAAGNTALNRADHEWSVIEMIDQMVRTKSGGEMMAYWMQPVILNQSTIEARLGHEFSQWRTAYEQMPAKGSAVVVKKKNLFQRLKQSRNKFRSGRLPLSEAKMQEALFQHSGEKHQWMYDRFSLSALLSSAGFEHIQQADAFNSRIAGWPEYRQLDVENDLVRKPDSLFMEAVKPLSHS